MRTIARLVVALALVASAAAQGDANDEDGQDEVVVVEEGQPQQVAPGLTITVNDDASRASYEVAQEIEYQPRRIEATIRYGQSFAPVILTLSSKVDTRVRVVPSDDDELIPISKDTYERLLAGYRMAVGFTAYAPHSGELRVFNEEDELLATVPYVVRAQSAVRQSVGARVSAGGGTSEETGGSQLEYGYDVQADYSITDRTTGISGRVRVSYDGDIEFGGEVSGQYSW